MKDHINPQDKIDSPNKLAPNIVEVQKGSLPPLFFLHEMSGTAFSYLELIRKLGKDRSIYLIEFDRGDCPAQNELTVEFLAASYIEKVRQFQPCGPYRLCGRSIGGLIAYEMVYQLLGEDEEIGFLGLIDTHCSSGSPLREITKLSEELDGHKYEMAVLANIIWRSNRDMSSVQVTHILDESKGLEVLLADCQNRGLISKQITLEEIRQRTKASKALFGAGLQYVPKPMDNAVHLYLSSELMFQQESLEWSRLIRNSLVLYRITESQDSPMGGQFVSNLAEFISQGLSAQDTSFKYAETHEDLLLIPLQFGKPDRPKIFCVPGAGSAASAFVSLSMSMGSDYSIYGFQPLGLDGDQVPHSTVAAAAKAYLKQLRNIEPCGPYQLLGHSFGGWVVYEMACQLQLQGEHVCPIFLLDTDPPWGEIKDLKKYTYLKSILLLIELQEEMLGRSLELPKEVLEVLSYEGQLEKLMAAMKKVGLLSLRSKLDVVKSLVRVFTVQLNAGYRPDSLFRGDMILIQPDESSDETGEFEITREVAKQAWQQYVNRCDRIIVPGKHTTILSEGNVDMISQRLIETWG